MNSSDRLRHLEIVVAAARRVAEAAAPMVGSPNPVRTFVVPAELRDDLVSVLDDLDNFDDPDFP